MYRKKYDEKEISTFIPLTYDAVMLFADAVHRAKSLDCDKVRDALAQTKDFQGATGTFSFNAQGDPLKDAVIMKISDGQRIYLKRIKNKVAQTFQKPKRPGRQLKANPAQ